MSPFEVEMSVLSEEETSTVNRLLLTNAACMSVFIEVCVFVCVYVF